MSAKQAHGYGSKAIYTVHPSSPHKATGSGRPQAAPYSRKAAAQMRLLPTLSKKQEKQHILIF